MIVIDEGRADVPFRRGSRAPRRVAAVLLVLALVWAGTRLMSDWHDRAPYSAKAVAAHTSARMVDIQQSQSAINRLVGPDRLNTTAPTGAHDHRQVVVGQVTFRTPRPLARHGEYALFVLDKFNDNAPVSQMWGIGPAGTDVGQGWDGAYNNIARKYRWLATLASVHVSDGWTDPGQAVVFAPNTTSPVTFAAVLPNSMSVKDPARRVTLALVFLGDGGQVYWADRLLG